MKQIIMLDDGSRVMSDGIEVKHIDAKGNVLYDTAKNKDIPGHDTKKVFYMKGKDVPAFPCFFLMGEAERKKVLEWFNEVNPKSEEPWRRGFLDRVERALKVIDYDYCIATYEPSFDKNGKIFYEAGNKVAMGPRMMEWKHRAEKFFADEKWHSDLALLEEGDLFKAYRIAMGFWTIEYVCFNSSSAGNYENAPDSIKEFEVSGRRKIGGFYDGVGNTSQIYQTEKDFVVVGGYCHSHGFSSPVASIRGYYDSKSDSYAAAGVLVIRRNTVHR